MAALRTIGPASIDVWISSPVRSRKPVLMKTTRSAAARIAAFRLTVVRRSSSMIPILSVLRGNNNKSSTRAKSSSVNATSAGPCIFGLTLRDVLRVDPDGVGIHVMSNVADQHQTAPGQRQFAAGGLLVRAIRVEPTVHHPSRLIEARGQRPLRQLQPVPVDLDLIGG